MNTLEKSQLLDQIPPIEIHEREVRRLWTACVAGGACLLLALGGAVLVATAALGKPVSSVAPAVGILMNVVALSFGIAFVIPAAVTSLKRLSLTIQMGHRSLLLARDMSTATAKLEKRADEVLSKAEQAFDKAAPVLEVLNRQAQDGFLEKIESHMRSIKEAVARETSPIPVRKREIQDDGTGG